MTDGNQLCGSYEINLSQWAPPAPAQLPSHGTQAFASR